MKEDKKSDKKEVEMTFKGTDSQVKKIIRQIVNDEDVEMKYVSIKDVKDDPKKSLYDIRDHQ